MPITRFAPVCFARQADAFLHFYLKKLIKALTDPPRCAKLFTNSKGAVEKNPQRLCCFIYSIAEVQVSVYNHAIPADF